MTPIIMTGGETNMWDNFGYTDLNKNQTMGDYALNFCADVSSLFQ